ncbi:MAG: hypothetical protein ACK4M7_05525, partial [Burkholderiales bacterium]
MLAAKNLARPINLTKRQPMTTESKQNYLTQFAHTVFGSSLNNPATGSTSPVDMNLIKAALQEIFTNKSELADENLKTAINILRTNREHNALTNFFGATKQITRSAVNAAVVLFLKSLVNINEGFDANGKLNISKFFTFLNNNLDTPTFNLVTQNITYRYLKAIKYTTNLSMINFANYAINTPITETNKFSGIKQQLFTENPSNGFITNKVIRREYDEREIINAKKLALNYFNDVVMEKINKLDSSAKHAVTLQIIYLHQMVNIAARDLSVYKLGYATLQELASNIFASLEINTPEERIHFLNSVILINYHRNCGMAAKRAIKAPIMLVWWSLPLISLGSMLIAGITSLNVMGLALGIIGVVGALVEGGGDVMNYGSYSEQLHKLLNCGDKLTSSTNTYQQVEQQLLENLPLKLHNLIPDNKETKENFCRGNKEKRAANIQLNNERNFTILQELKHLRPITA